MNSLELVNEDKEYIMNSYNRFNLALKCGKGATIYDMENKKYIDFGSGIGVTSFGYSDDEWLNAVVEQAKRVQHTSNLYYTEPQAELAKLLCEKTGMKKVFFANSGAEANEGAIKAARKYSYDKYGENRYEIITLVNSFHGRTLMTLTATGQDKFHKYFGPFAEGFKYAKANDIEDLNSKISDKTCAIMIETVQGEGGVNNLDENFVKYIDKICKEKDIMFIVDEVQTGNGRTGYLYSYMAYGVTPNIVSTAKGLAGGLPFGAILFDSKVEKVFGYGDHGTTFGGNPICANAALSVLRRIDDNLLNHVNECNKIICERLGKIKGVKISGRGLMLGISIEGKIGGDVAKKCLEKGLMVLTAKEKVRLLPPLNISFEELNEGLNILEEAIKE